MDCLLPLQHQKQGTGATPLAVDFSLNLNINRYSCLTFYSVVASNNKGSELSVAPPFILMNASLVSVVRCVYQVPLLNERVVLHDRSGWDESRAICLFHESVPMPRSC